MTGHKNTGVTYETLTQGFFQAILDQSAVHNVEVERDRTMPGKSGTRHQIDVYWAFEVGGITYQTVVQCKDWATRVKQEQVFAFRSVIEDLPGQPRGIIVSREGFQEGAKAFAKAHGIALYTLREADEEYWAGRIKTVAITGNLFVPHVDNVNLVADLAWAEEVKKALGVESLQIPFEGVLGDMQLMSETEEALGNLGDAIEADAPKGFGVLPPETRVLRFPRPVFLLVAATPGRIKILGVSYQFSRSVMQSRLEIDGADAVKFVLESFGDDLQVYTADGQLRVTSASRGVGD